MPWIRSRYPHVDRTDEILQVSAILDPVLASDSRLANLARRNAPDRSIFCRWDVGNPDDGCIDLVVDFEPAPDWHIVDVRYWGFPGDKWHLPFERDADLARQLALLALSLPSRSAWGTDRLSGPRRSVPGALPNPISSRSTIAETQ